MSDSGQTNHDARLQDSHDLRQRLLLASFALGLLAVVIILAVVVIGSMWPSQPPCLPGAKDCVTVPNWGHETVAQIMSCKDLIFDLVSALVGIGGGILQFRGAFDAFIGKRQP